ncbi:Hsp20/alpha crystallin family protein [bacterium]|nr:Hsp20/alpha crystallin family protein [bacterium]
MPMIKREIYREFEALRRQMNRLMESFFVKEPMAIQEDSWTPAYDLVEDKDGIMVKVELPGIDEDDLSLTLTGQTLVIKGERRVEQPTKDQQIHRVERWYGTFERVITIPVLIDEEDIKANYKKGILVIYLPKKAEAEPIEIPISLH